MMDWIPNVIKIDINNNASNCDRQNGLQNRAASTSIDGQMGRNIGCFSSNGGVLGSVVRRSFPTLLSSLLESDGGLPAAVHERTSS